MLSCWFEVLQHPVSLIHFLYLRKLGQRHSITLWKQAQFSFLAIFTRIWLFLQTFQKGSHSYSWHTLHVKSIKSARFINDPSLAKQCKSRRWLSLLGFSLSLIHVHLTCALRLNFTQLKNVTLISPGLIPPNIVLDISVCSRQIGCNRLRWKCTTC